MQINGDGELLIPEREKLTTPFLETGTRLSFIQMELY